MLCGLSIKWAAIGGKWVVFLIRDRWSQLYRHLITFVGKTPGASSGAKRRSTTLFIGHSINLPSTAHYFSASLIVSSIVDCPTFWLFRSSMVICKVYLPGLMRLGMRRW